MSYQVICGNNIEVLKTLADNSVDSIVTDPPYGIDFLGKAWDSDTGSLETYQQCYRVLKPGGHILAFSAARTYHHLAMTVERAGFEIRDQIMWIYGSGFPKSQDVGRQIDKRLGNKGITGPLKRGAERMINSTDENGNRDNNNGVWANEVNRVPHVILPESDEAKKWSGWGTALKPAHEPIVLARKPISEKNIADNCLKHGTGALNIDATRVDNEVRFNGPAENNNAANTPIMKSTDDDYFGTTVTGRFPANIIGEIHEPYQKYFYCPKVSRRERHIGHDDPGPLFPGADGGGWQVVETNNGNTTHKSDKGNNHPTVKPVQLMKYLIRLVTPPGGLVVDPFNGSGSTGMAAVEGGYDYLGIDLDQNYVDISLKRIAAWEAMHKQEPTSFSQLFTER